MRLRLLLILPAALGGCAEPARVVDRRSVDQGYILGTSDSVKQLYWAKQALEAPRSAQPAGRIKYYTWEDRGAARDGRKLAPESVAVPVFVPAPAPGAGGTP